MKISTTHHMDKQVVRAKIEGEIVELVERFGQYVSNLDHHWCGDTMEFSFKAIGNDLLGSVHVTNRNFDLEIRIPSKFRIIEGQIKDEARDWCNKVLN